MQTPSERQLRERLASTIREIVDERELVYKRVPLPKNLLSTVVCNVEKDVYLSTVARVADALGYDVVLHFRERR